jgi:hypothetical protein
MNEDDIQIQNPRIKEISLLIAYYLTYTQPSGLDWYVRAAL